MNAEPAIVGRSPAKRGKCSLMHYAGLIQILSGNCTLPCRMNGAAADIRRLLSRSCYYL